ncbi:acetylxylan esterase [Streptomyces sp. NBC_01387]|uniref:acetylxylan esterase n=1 Tax=unclassified Streptomyces TaxID=2593676 RepID=UPI002DD8FE72|nr:acetylxylan esterase [Streptomyces sp. NBC_01766]WSC24111.1 acetylxylan esterase [Streptomyces sp. NBC_01766]
MPLTDLTLAECLAYRSEATAPAAFDTFWAGTLADSRPVEPVFTPVDSGLSQIRVYDVTFPGFDGAPVRGWLRLPAGPPRRLGCVVEFLGYGRGRGLAHENLLWPAAGFAHLVMDTRGQGWSSAPGCTPDEGPSGVGPVPGFLTRGVQSPETHYYRRLYADAVRCVEAARSHPEIDPDRIVVAGVSQGGGITLAVSGLVPGLAGVMPDVPFLCDMRRGVERAAMPPYTEIAEYLQLNRDRAQSVFETLSYFDGVHFAARATAPAFFSIALMDPICPPSTCFGAYHAYAGPKQVEVYGFNGHEGGGEHHRALQLAWVRELIG